MRWTLPLRRPGRFDREFYFALPNIDARKKILGIITKKWDGWGRRLYGGGANHWATRNINEGGGGGGGGGGDMEVPIFE